MPVLRTMITAVLLALVGTGSAAAAPSSPAVDVPGVAGHVNALLVDGDTAYVGGRFHAVGRPSGPVVAYSPADGRVLERFTHITGGPPPTPLAGTGVSAIEPDGSGGWYAGGGFGTVGGQPRADLARFRADGSLDPAFRPKVAGGNVNALALDGATLWVGGTFSHVNGVQRPYLVALDAATGELLPVGFDRAAGSVSELELAGGRLYVGGTLVGLGEQECRRLCVIDTATRTPLDWNAEISETFVYDVEVDGATVYVAGDFFAAGRRNNHGLAALRATDGTTLPADFGFEHEEVYDITVTADAVIAGGPFDRVHGEPHPTLAAFDKVTGAQLPGFEDVTGEVSASYLDGHTLYVEGVGSAGGVARGGLAAFDVRTRALLPWAPGGRVGGIRDIESIGGRLLMGGSIGLVDAVERNNAAAIDLRTGAVLPWDPDLTDAFSSGGPSVRALAKQGDAVYLGGTFVTVGGTVHKHLAAVDAATGDLRATAPEASLEVNALALAGSTLYVGGNFTRLGGQDVRALGAVELPSGQVSSFAPRFDCQVSALAVSDGRLHVGGCFDGAHAVFDRATGARVPEAEIDLDGTVRALAPDRAGGIWVGGTFSFAPALFHLGPDGSALPAPAIDGIVDALVPAGEELFVGGGFDEVGGVLRSGAASIGLGDGVVRPFDPAIDGRVLALAVTGDSGLLTGGVFGEGGGRAAGAVARFPGDGVPYPPMPEAEQTPDAGPPPAGSAPAAPTEGGATAATAAPRVSVLREPRRRIARRGLRVRVRVPGTRSVRVEVVGSGRVLGRRSVQVAGGRARTARVRVRLPARPVRIRVALRDADTGALLTRSARVRIR